MKLSSLQENLKQGLFTVAHVAGKNVNLPILNNVLIEAKDGNIKFVATDLEIGVVSKIRGKIEKEGSFTVDSKIITDYIGLLPNKKVSFEQSGNDLKIECDNYNTKMKGQSAEDYPLIPQIDKKTFYSAKTDEFRKALAQVVFAVSTSESRLELTGVLFSFNKDKMTLVATDSYRLTEKTINLKTNTDIEGDKNKAQSIIVPAKTLQEIIRIMSGIKEGGEIESVSEVKFYISDNQILFTIGSTEIVSRLIEGQYPDYQQIIPTNNKTAVVVNKNEITRAVKAASLFSKTGINDINLDFPQGKNHIVVSSASGQTGENTTFLDANISGDDNGVVVNYRYLLDGLNNMESEDVRLEIIDSNTPCVLKPDKEVDYIYIIMPIKQ